MAAAERPSHGRPRAQQFGSARRDSQTALLATRKAAPAQRIVILNNHAALMLNEHRLDDAGALAQEAVALAEQHLPHDHPAHATALRNLGVALERTGDRERALEALRTSLAIRRRIYDPTSSNVGEALGFLVEALIGSGRFEEALERQREALDLAFARQPPDLAEVAGELAPLGAILRELGRFEDAILVRAGEKRGLLGAMVLAMRADALAQLGQHESAAEMALDALAIDQTLNPEPGPSLVRAYSTAADTLILVGELDDAERVVRGGLVVLDQIEPMGNMRGKLALDLAKIALARGDRAALRRRCAEAVDAVLDTSARAEIAAWCESNRGPRSERE